MEKTKIKNSYQENNNTSEIVLLDSLTDLSNVKINPNSKVISLDYITHKTLKERKIVHEISDNYISNLEKKQLFDYMVSCAEWYKKIPTSIKLEFHNVNILSSMNQMEFHLEFINTVIKIYTISNIITLLKPTHISISSNLENYVDQFKNDKIIQIIASNKNIERGFNAEQIELRFNFLFKPVTFYISKIFYAKLKSIQENIICSIFRLWYKPDSNYRGNLILEFNPSLFPTLLSELSHSKSQTILFNQRRSAIWNWTSIQNLRKNHCKIINPDDFFNLDDNTMQTIQEKYHSILSDFWLNEENNLESIFSKNNVRFWPVLKDKFQKLYNSRLDHFLKQIVISKNILQNINLNSILSLNEQGETEKLLNHSFEHKTPTLLLQHSFFKYYDELYDAQKRYDSEFTYDLKSQYFLLWGNSDKSFYKKFGIEEKKLVVTGSPKHESFFNSNLNIKNNSFTVLLALNPMTNFSGLCNVKSFLNYEKFISKLLNFLKSIKNIKIIIKLHPGENFHNQILNDFLKTKFPEITVYQTKSSKQLIQSCNLMIHTTPEFYEMSTIMLESMILNKPVIEIYFDEEPKIKKNKIPRISFKGDLNHISEIISDVNLQENLVKQNNELIENYLSNTENAGEKISEFINKLENS